jgi:hypothetical protein
MGALSTAFVMIKRAKFQVLRTMQEVSLYTMKPPEPSIDPVAKHRHLRIHIKRSSPLAVLYIKSAGKMVLMNLVLML